MATAATIVVNIEGNAAGANRALKSARVEMGFFQDAMRATGLGTVSLGTMIGTFATGAVRDAIGWVKDLGSNFVSLVNDQAQEIDKLGKLANRLGVSTEAMAGLEHAAALSDISTEDLGGHLTKLNRTFSEARSGNKEAIKTFDELGLSVADLAGMSLDQILFEVADAMQNVRLDSDKTRLAMELFGRGGAPMLTMLKDGAKGLASAMAEAKEFGLTFSAVDFAMVEEMNDDFTRLGQLIKGLGREAAAELAPVMSVILDDIIKLGKDGEVSFGFLTEAILRTVGAAENLANAWNKITGTEGVSSEGGLSGSRLSRALSGLGILFPKSKRLEEAVEANKMAAEVKAIDDQILREFKERQAAEAEAAKAAKAVADAEWAVYDAAVALQAAKDQRLAEQIATDILKEKGPTLTALAGTQLGSREALMAQTQFERQQLLGGAGKTTDEAIRAAVERHEKIGERQAELTQKVLDVLREIRDDEGIDLE